VVVLLLNTTGRAVTTPVQLRETGLPATATAEPFLTSAVEVANRVVAGPVRDGGFLSVFRPGPW
jgi:hypothetical protein